MNIKYIIFAFIIIIVILLIFLIVKHTIFNKKNNKKITNNELKITSKNGDMTLNEFAKDNISMEDNLLIENNVNEQNNLLMESIRPRPRRIRPTNNTPANNTHANIMPANNNTPANNTPANNTPANNIRPANIGIRPANIGIRPANIGIRIQPINNIRLPDNIIPLDNIRPPDNVIVDRLIPLNNLDEMFDDIFNNITVIMQTIDNNNEFNIIQHMNENNIHPIIIHNNNALMELLDNQIMDMLGNHRDNLINARQAEATSNAETRAQAIDNYINITTRQTNDTQNVHDHTVLAGFKLILERLINDRNNLENCIELKTLDEIKDEINQKGRRLSSNRPNITLKVLSVIDKMKMGEQITAFEINGTPTTDAMCLQLVWDRANHPLNANNKELMKQSIFDNLLDSWEIDAFGVENIVCVTGRATRMLGSLVMLDFDEKNWEVKKFEEFKNDIFNKVKNIIMEQAKLATESNNIDMQNAGKTYLATTSEEFKLISTPSNDTILELNNNIKHEISNMINSYVMQLESEFHTTIPQYMKNSVEKEAIASIDMF